MAIVSIIPRIFIPSFDADMKISRIILLCVCLICVAATHQKFKSENVKSNFFQLLFGSSSSIRTCDCKCGIPNRRTRLLGGTDLRPYEFPWLAQITAQGLLPIEATLLNDRYVISAAITLIGFSPYDIKVQLGIYDSCYPDVTSTILSVSSITLHPEFQIVSRQNDIALVRMSTIVPYHRRISPICLPTPDMSYERQVATIASWLEGLSSDNYALTTCQPRKIELPVMHTGACTGFLIESQGCVGVVGSRSPLCKDDAGSAVLYSNPSGYYELIGILSDKQSCSTTDRPATSSDFNLPMFTKVNSFLNWILYNTKDACYCNKI